MNVKQLLRPQWPGGRRHRWRDAPGPRDGRGAGELGTAVCLASRRGALCEDVAAGLRGAGIDAWGAACDVTEADQVDALMARVLARHGRLDVLVANAGGALTRSYIPDASLEEFRRTLELNVTGTYICAQSAAGP